MEFVEAVNPHYAVPILGVIVCCLLVFAFGFKSPGQPPSFDIVDEERKVVKKRKGKENQKVKPQQNGKVATVVSAKVEASPHAQKTKVAVAKPVNKSESKPSNKKARSQQSTRQAEIGSKTEVNHSEDANEDGWVQLVSKKERKNRKKDDVAPCSVDVSKVEPTVAEVESCFQVIENNESSSSPKEEVIQSETEKENETSENAVEKEVSEGVKATPKAQKTPKKKKAKKEEEDEEESPEQNAAKEFPASDVPEFPQENGIISESKSYTSVSSNKAVVEPPVDDLLQVHEVAEVSEEEGKSKAKKKKSKKKNQENVTMEDAKSEISHAHPQENNVVEQETVSAKEIIETKYIHMEHQGAEDKKVEAEEPVSVLGSNVVFDELKDLCQEEKPQKKKKKVRREH